MNFQSSWKVLWTTSTCLILDLCGSTCPSYKHQQPQGGQILHLDGRCFRLSPSPYGAHSCLQNNIQDNVWPVRVVGINENMIILRILEMMLDFDECCVDDYSFMRHSLGHSPLDWVETICENAHVMGESYSSRLSWDDVCGLLLCSSRMSWVNLIWSHVRFLWT